VRPGAWERVARWFAGGSAGVHSADAPAQLAGMLHDVVESHAAAKVICCCSSALHRSKQGMQLAARAQHGVVLSRRRVAWSMCARPPPTADVAPGGVVVCVPTGGRDSIVRKSKSSFNLNYRRSLLSFEKMVFGCQKSHLQPMEEGPEQFYDDYQLPQSSSRGTQGES
jgi:hypothetical protein